MAVALLTVGLFLVAYRQWRTSEQQAKVMEHGLRLTRESNEVSARNATTAERAMQLLERAEITVDITHRFDLEPPGLFVLLTNGGRSRAEVRRIGVRRYVSTTDVLPSSPTYDEGQEVSVVIQAGASYAHVLVLAPGAEESAALREVVAGRRRFGCWGYVLYEDIFGSSRRTNFGMEYQPQLDRFVITPRPGFNRVE